MIPGRHLYPITPQLGSILNFEILCTVIRILEYRRTVGSGADHLTSHALPDIRTSDPGHPGIQKSRDTFPGQITLYRTLPHREYNQQVLWHITYCSSWINPRSAIYSLSKGDNRHLPAPEKVHKRPQTQKSDKKE